MPPNNVVRIGISGTGFIARSLERLLAKWPDKYQVTTVLTRRDPACVSTFPEGILITRDTSTLVDNCDLVVECSGTVYGAARVARAVTDAGKPLVTMNAEFQLTLGSLFARTGLVREAQGDQPGSLAALDEEARAMGFEPLVYASQKGFLNHNPSPEDMNYWARKQGISVLSTVSFTDGTKVQIEQALVANCLGSQILQEGLLGPSAPTLEEGGTLLAREAEKTGAPVADYVLQAGGKGEVFIIAKHDAPPDQLRYYKLGDGPYFLIGRNFHLGHFEIPLTLDRVLHGLPGPMTVSEDGPFSVAAIAKRDLPLGHKVSKAVGSFDLRGVAVRCADRPEHVPIGLLENCRLRRPVRAGDMIQWGDIDLLDESAEAIVSQLAQKRGAETSRQGEMRASS